MITVQSNTLSIGLEFSASFTMLSNSVFNVRACTQEQEKDMPKRQIRVNIVRLDLLRVLDISKDIS